MGPGKLIWFTHPLLQKFWSPSSDTISELKDTDSVLKPGLIWLKVFLVVPLGCMGSEWNVQTDQMRILALVEPGGFVLFSSFVWVVKLPGFINPVMLFWI